MGLGGQTKYHRQVVRYTMGLGVKQNTIGRWFDIPLIGIQYTMGFGGQTKYHKQVIQYTIGKGVHFSSN